MIEGVTWQFDREKRQDHRGLTGEKWGQLPLGTAEQNHSIGCTASSCNQHLLGFAHPERNPGVTDLGIGFEASSTYEFIL